MKIESINRINDNELISCSRFFKGANYTDCDKALSFICTNDDGEFCGFALARKNNIDLNCEFGDAIDITYNMNGCEILQIYANTIDLELQLLKRLLHRIVVWCYNDTTFDYLWSESLSEYDFYADSLDCKKITQRISDYEIKNIIYNIFKSEK